MGNNQAIVEEEEEELPAFVVVGTEYRVVVPVCAPRVGTGAAVAGGASSVVAAGGSVVVSVFVPNMFPMACAKLASIGCSSSSGKPLLVVVVVAMVVTRLGSTGMGSAGVGGGMLGSTGMGSVAPPVVAQGFPPPESVVAQGLPGMVVEITGVGSVVLSIAEVLGVSVNVVRDPMEVTISEVLGVDVVIGPADVVGDSVGVTI